MPEVKSFIPNFGGRAGFTHKVHQELMRQGLSSRSAALLTAHMALSSRWGEKAHNYILAGVKAGGQGVCYGTAQATYHPYTCLCSFERGASRQGYISSCPAGPGQPRYCPPKPMRGEMVPRCQYPFRAYTSLADGVAGVLKTLRYKRYALPYDLLLAGDTSYFIEIGKAGWYTAKLQETSSAMENKYLPQVYKYLKLPMPSVGMGSAFAWTGIGYLLFKYAVPMFR